MPNAPSIDLKTTALLVMDYQTAIVDMAADGKDELLKNMTAVIAAARRAKMKIVYVVVGFRPGYPEISPDNMSFSALKTGGLFAQGSPGTEIHSAVAPTAQDVIVTKHRVGAFLGTDMEMVLRANKIETLLLAGIATSGVVLSTLRHAADADFCIVVIADCCSDRDAEVHRVLTQKVFPRQAVVTTADAILAAL